MKWLRGHGPLLVFIAGAVACIAGVAHGPIEENVLALIPQSIKQQVELFGHSPLSQKMMVVAQAPSATQAFQTAQQIREQLLQEQLIRPVGNPAADFIPQVLDVLPTLFTSQDQLVATRKLTPRAVASQFDRYQEGLFSLESMFTKQQMTQDPLFLTEIFFDKWKKLGQGNTEYQDGLLASPDGTVQVGLYDSTAVVSDLTAARRLQRWFTQQQQRLPAGVRVFFMGGLRYTLENMSVIKRDLMLISLVGLALLGSVFGLFFRNRRALLIYLLPIGILPPAALVTQLVFGRISGITLGFGSVVAGLSVDYAIYVYFACQTSSVDSAKMHSQIRKHLWCNFLTSALCFAALFLSSVEVFKQIAVFALVALSLALGVALKVFPAYFRSPVSVAPRGIKIKPLSWRSACSVSVLLVVWGIWGITHTSLRQGLEALNSTSSAFAQDKKITDQLFTADKRALLFSLGKTADEALVHNENLSAVLPVSLPVSELFVSAKTRAENQTRWQQFWTPGRIRSARQSLRTEAVRHGLNPAAFESFWKRLQQPHSPTVDFTAWYNPILTLTDGSYAVMNIVEDTPVYQTVAQQHPAVFVSASQLQQKLARGVKDEAVQVVIWALLFNGVAVWMIFRNFKEALLCFVPVILGGCILFGCLAFFGITVNILGLIFLPLLVGLGIDYAIFQLMKYRAAREQLHEVYPPQALLAAGLSTLAGFGVLGLARHSVLFMMGICALIGIGGAVGVALFILPAFRERVL